MPKRRGRGEGSIYQREDGLWVGQLTIGRTAQGKQRRKVVYGATKADVHKKLLHLRQKYVLDGTPDGESMVVKNCLDFWLDTVVKMKVGVTSYSRYKVSVETHIKPYLGHLKMGELEAFKIGQWYRDLEEAEFGPSARFNAGKRLRQFLRYCVRFGIVNKNEADKIPLPRYRAPEVQPLSNEQIKAILTANRDDPWYPLLVLALDSGARQGEMLALNWSDVDWDRGEIVITKNVQRKKTNGSYVKDVKTPKSRRRVRLTAPTVAALREQKARTDVARHKSSIVFPSRAGTHLTYATLKNHLWPRLLKRAGLPGSVTFHSLRHTSASLLLLGYEQLRPVHIKVVSERLGHSSIEITLKTYAHILPTHQEQAVDVMGGLLGWAVGNSHSQATVDGGSGPGSQEDVSGNSCQ